MLPRLWARVLLPEAQSPASARPEQNTTSRAASWVSCYIADTSFAGRITKRQSAPVKKACRPCEGRPSSCVHLQILWLYISFFALVVVTGRVPVLPAAYRSLSNLCRLLQVLRQVGGGALCRRGLPCTIDTELWPESLHNRCYRQPNSHNTV